MFRKLKYILIYNIFMLDSPARPAGQPLVFNNGELFIKNFMFFLLIKIMSEILIAHDKTWN